MSTASYKKNRWSGRNPRRGPGGRGLEDEFGLIEALLRYRGAAVKGVRVGPGDDAAVVRPPGGHDLVVTTDVQVEGVHFRWGWLRPRWVGFRAGAACLSDLAAMGAGPWVAVSSLAIPPDVPAPRLIDVQKGLDLVLREHGAALIGGNVSRSPGAFSITLTAIGTLPAGTQIERHGVRAGDRIWVSGTPGKAALGLDHLLRAIPGPAYVRAFRRPPVRIALGQALRRARLASAMIDISDGVAGDLAHLLTPEHFGARLDLPALIPDRAFVRRCRELDLEPERLVLHGGEDYELLFTVPAHVAPRRILDLGTRMRLKVRQVGVVEEQPGLRVVAASGSVRPIQPVGFRHRLAAD